MNPEINDRFRRRMFGTSPPWLIEQHARGAGDNLTFSGWALPPGGDLDAVTFLVNGVPAESIRYGLPSPHLAEVYSYMPNAGHAHFICDQPIDMNLQSVEIAFADAATLQPFNRWHSFHLPLSGLEKLATPEAGQLVRTQGLDNIRYYFASGLTTARKLERILNLYFQRSLQDHGNLLDWGCGCGRVLQLIRQSGSRMSLHGADVDVQNIAWCEEQIPHVFFSNIPLRPPLDVPDGFFDVVYGISVINHLSHEDALLWLAELARVTRPQGAVILTLNAEYDLARIASPALIRATLENGYHDGLLDQGMDGFIPEEGYYRSCFYSSRFLRECLGRWFEFMDQLPGADACAQDYVILKKR